MKKIIMIGVVCFCFFSTVCGMGFSFSQQIDEIYNWYQSQIEERIVKIPLKKVREQQADRLWKAKELSLHKYIRVWNDTDKLKYQVISTKIVERKNDYLTQSTIDLIFQQELINAINNYRKTKNLWILTYSSLLTKIAYNHSLDLSLHFPYDADRDGKVDIISHIWTDGSRVGNRAQRLWYYGYIVENIAYNQITAYQVLLDWINSPTHYDNIVSSRVTHIWVSKIGPYCVLVMWRIE